MANSAFTDGIKLLKEGAEADDAWKGGRADEGAKAITLYERGIEQLNVALACKFKSARAPPSRTRACFPCMADRRVHALLAPQLDLHSPPHPLARAAMCALLPFPLTRPRSPAVSMCAGLRRRPLAASPPSPAAAPVLNCARACRPRVIGPRCCPGAVPLIACACVRAQPPTPRSPR